jgi:hypothetical protein
MTQSAIQSPSHFEPATSPGVKLELPLLCILLPVMIVLLKKLGFMLRNIGQLRALVTLQSYSVNSVLLPQTCILIANNFGCADKDSGFY